MTRSSVTSGARSWRVLRHVLAALCLAAPFVALLWVPWYARREPALAGMPFFYWYQLAWVPTSVVLMFVAYLLLRRRPVRGDSPEIDRSR
jgi:membrane protein implicated in regulation of membrane protease activity